MYYKGAMQVKLIHCLPSRYMCGQKKYRRNLKRNVLRIHGKDHAVMLYFALIKVVKLLSNFPYRSEKNIL